MSFPTAKKVCDETTRDDTPPDPTTPFDDFDDLYGDSPAINRYREKSLPQSIDKIALPPPNQSPPSKSFQLPGLGLFTAEQNDLTQVINASNKPVTLSDAGRLPPAEDLQVTQRTQSLSREAPLGTHEKPSQHAGDGSIHLDETEIRGEPSLEHSGGGRIGATELAFAEGNLIEPKRPTLEQNGVEVANKATARTIDDRGISAVQSATDGMTEYDAAERMTDGLSSDKARINTQQGPLQDISNATDLSNGSSVPQTGTPQQTKDVKNLGATRTSTKEDDGATTSVSDPIHQMQDGNYPAVPPPSSPTVIAEPRFNGLASPAMQRNIEVDAIHGVNHGINLSSNTDVPQSSLPQPTKASDVAEADGQQTFEEIAKANKKNGEAEFELDSSPIESSSESESDSSSSSEDSDYEMLDPEEEARRLMQEDGGSDDEGGKGGKAHPGPLRTLNEKPDEIIPKPQIELTAEMTVSALGSVEHVVENSILVKGKTSGESRALESGSLLCLEDRSVVGVIAELLGQVQQPYYSVRFTNPAAIAEAGISKGTSIFFVEQHSSYVFTQSLKALKGSDASNMHDEEVGDDELEFSDDEAEAEHKRRVKQERQARRGGREERGDRAERDGNRGGRGDRGDRKDCGGRKDRIDGFSKGPRGSQLRGRGRGKLNETEPKETSTPTMNYDDDNDGEDLYTPLARPSNLHEIMGRGEAPQEDPNPRMNGSMSGHGFQRGGRPERGRGRGERGYGGRGARGDWRGRGGFNGDSRNRQYDNQEQRYQNHPPSSPHHTNGYPSFPSSNGTPAPPSYGWPNQFAPNHSMPSTPAYQQPSPQQSYPTYPPNAYTQPHIPSQPPYQPQQSPPPSSYNQYPPYQAPSPTSPVPSNIPAGAHINPAFFASAAQQPWQQQHSYGGEGGGGGGGGNRSPQSQEAFKAAQDRLELLRMLTRNDGPPP
ncbi:MAG: hypothetical protein L6R40_004860 [Gallowayella cf. fulva]|nr:MAG: hypothetical protein L6R40_004860 [Xanthomendoza cf. fulva]